MVEDLATLVGDEAAFIAAFVRKERLLVKTAEPRRAEGLLPLWMLERLITSDAMPATRLTVLRDGDVVPASTFRTADGRVRKDALIALIAQGVSFVIAGIQDDVPDIARLSGALAQRLGHAVWVNAYVTHGRGGALAPHYDDHDVLVLQVHGQKRWYSHGTPTHAPIERSPDGVDFGPASWDALLSPGDVLYLPRGEVHHAEAEAPGAPRRERASPRSVEEPHVEGHVSVHLTFGIDTKRGVDFAAWIVEGLASEPLFREDITRLGGEPALRERERALKSRLHALVDAADVSVYLAEDEARRG